MSSYFDFPLNHKVASARASHKWKGSDKGSSINDVRQFLTIFDHPFPLKHNFYVVWFFRVVSDPSSSLKSNIINEHSRFSLGVSKVSTFIWFHWLFWWAIYYFTSAPIWWSCHIQSVEIVVEYWIYCQILDLCFLFNLQLFFS